MYSGVRCIFASADTPGVLIFYTLDGSKPDMVQCGSAARGRKYSKPIRLPAGRVAVRAIAVTRLGLKLHQRLLIKYFTARWSNVSNPTCKSRITTKIYAVNRCLCRSKLSSSVCSDGKESSIVTKMFMVQNRDSNKEKGVLLTNEKVTKPPPQSSWSQ